MDLVREKRGQIMACSSTWDPGNRAPDSIAGNRRADRRYSMLLDLRWKLIHRKRVLDSGEGSTIDLSSGGVRFESSRALPTGLNVKLAISWPVFLRGVTPTQLMVHGRIVRSEGGQIAEPCERPGTMAMRQPIAPAPAGLSWRLSTARPVPGRKRGQTHFPRRKMRLSPFPTASV